MISYCWRKTNRVNYAKVQLEYDRLNIYIRRNNATDLGEETEHGKSLFIINEILNHLGHKRKDIQMLLSRGNPLCWSTGEKI